MSDVELAREPPRAPLVFIYDTERDDDNDDDARCKNVTKRCANDARRATTRLGRGRHRATLVANAPPRERSSGLDDVALSLDDIDARADAYVPKWWTAASASASATASGESGGHKSKQPSRSNAALAFTTTHVFSGDVNAACRRAYLQVLSDADPCSPVVDAVVDVERRFSDFGSCHATVAATTLSAERATMELGSSFRDARGVEFTQQMKMRLDGGLVRAMVPTKATITVSSSSSSLQTYDAFVAMHKIEDDDKSRVGASTGTTKAVSTLSGDVPRVDDVPTARAGVETPREPRPRTSTSKFTYAYDFGNNSPRATLTMSSKPGKSYSEKGDGASASAITLANILSTVEVLTRVSSDVLKRTHAARTQWRAKIASGTSAKATTKASVTKGTVSASVDFELMHDITRESKLTTSISFPSKVCGLKMAAAFGSASALEAKLTSKEAVFGARHHRGRGLDFRFGVKRTFAGTKMDGKMDTFVAVAFAAD